MSYRPDDACSETGRLLMVVERLHDAVVSRDRGMVRALLDAASAASIPRAVREEVLVVSALPVASLRAPMQLLLFHRRLTELTRDTDAGAVLAQIELPFDRGADWR